MRWLGTLAAAMLLALPAEAATWRQVTASNGTSNDQVGLLRTADGVLHLAWHQRTGPNTEDMHHTVLTPGGAVGATVPIVTGWSILQNAALVPAPGGIRVFFGGIRSTQAGEPNQELNTALSADGGTTWALQVGSIVPLGAQPHGSPVSASALPDGTPLQAWAGSLGTWVHRGLSPASPNHDYQGPLGNYGYDPGLASSATGQTMMAWYSNASGRLGVHVQEVNADGSPAGAPRVMPGTSAMPVGMIGRTPIVARPAGGFYVAYATGYPALDTVRLWRVGSGSTSVIAKTGATGTTSATVAAAPGGRLWVAWLEHRGGAPRVFARRSNPGATRFGAAVDAGRPRGASSGYRIDASASGSRLDLLASFSFGVSPGVGSYHARILPGLTLGASRRTIPRGRATSVTFTVTDAGDPVRNARVRAGGRAARTDRRGRATLRLTGGRRALTAVATAAGYVEDTVVLRVRGPR